MRRRGKPTHAACAAAYRPAAAPVQAAGASNIKVTGSPVVTLPPPSPPSAKGSTPAPPVASTAGASNKATVLGAAIGGACGGAPNLPSRCNRRSAAVLSGLNGGKHESILLAN